MKKCGFRNEYFQDKTKDTQKSVRYFGRLARIMWPIAKLLYYVPNPYLQSMYLNATALHNIDLSYQLGIGQYCLHVGSKPIHT